MVERSPKRRGTLKKQNTMDPGVGDNMFLHQAHINMMNQDVYSEKPRANLYNVIKRLRENSVSTYGPAFCETPLIEPHSLVWNQTGRSREQTEGRHRKAGL